MNEDLGSSLLAELHVAKVVAFVYLHPALVGEQLGPVLLLRGAGQVFEVHRFRPRQVGLGGDPDGPPVRVLVAVARLALHSDVEDEVAASRVVGRAAPALVRKEDGGVNQA